MTLQGWPEVSRLIGLVGLARSGKDTAGEYLLAQHQFSKTAMFAGPLKDAARHIFGLSHEEVHGVNYDRESAHPAWGFSVRHMLQKLGTESVRDIFGQDHWVQLMRLRLATGDLRGEDVVITDVRFDNEVDMIRSLGGKVVGIVRLGDNAPRVEPHISEDMAAFRLDEVTDWTAYAENVVELYKELNTMMGDLYSAPAPSPRN